jgi:hypothetical protein
MWHQLSILDNRDGPFVFKLDVNDQPPRRRVFETLVDMDTVIPTAVAWAVSWTLVINKFPMVPRS